MVGSFTRVGYDVRRRVFDWADLDGFDLSGRTVLVTGANSGLGAAAATRLAGLGASLRLLVRSDEKGERTRDRIVAATGNTDVDYGVADLADLASVRAFADRTLERERRLDVVIHNAGAMFDERRETVDGIEMTVAVHVVGPFLLTSRLLPLLADSAPARVITVSSGGMYTQPVTVGKLESPDDYRPATAYARAKRAQVALAGEWARRFAGRGIAFHTMHPGWADTPGVRRSLPVFSRIVGPLLRDGAQGADTIVWLAAAPEAAHGSGAFWLDRRPRPQHKVRWTRRDSDVTQRLWARVAELAGVDPSAVLDARTEG